MVAEKGESGYWFGQLVGYLCQDEARLEGHAIERQLKDYDEK